MQELTLTVEEAEGCVAFQVADEGPGHHREQRRGPGAHVPLEDVGLEEVHQRPELGIVVRGRPDYAAHHGIVSKRLTQDVDDFPGVLRTQDTLPRLICFHQ